MTDKVLAVIFDCPQAIAKRRKGYDSIHLDRIETVLHALTGRLNRAELITAVYKYNAILTLAVYYSGQGT